MLVNKYVNVVGDTRYNKSHLISTVNRDKYMTDEYIKMSSEFLNSLVLDGKTAMLVAGGPVSHHSESRVFNDEYVRGSVAIKSQMSYSIYALIHKLKNVSLDYLNINGNTCASSMHSIHEAYDLIHNKGFDHVIVIAMEQVEKDELLLFEQLNIDLVCGDGFCFMVFSKECDAPIAEVTSTTFVWNNEKHPMCVSTEGYIKTIRGLSLDVNIVKTHGTGTQVNDSAENSAINDVFQHIKTISFKDKIGHTQGASALIELAMLLDTVSCGDKVMCLASGLGGFYGGCTVTKL